MDLTEELCYSYLHFLKRDLQKVLVLFRKAGLPTTFVGENGHAFTGEESFLVTLFHLTEGTPFVKMGAPFLFGGDGRHLGGMYVLFLQWLDGMALGLVHGNSLEWWVPVWPVFNSLLKSYAKREWDFEFREGEMMVMSTLDCQMRDTLTAGSGPAVRGRNAPRHPNQDLYQESIFTGYGKRHGVKGLTVTFPNGLVGNVWFPVSMRENNTVVLNLSNMEDYLQWLQPEARGGTTPFYTILVDSISPIRRTLQKRIRPPIGGSLTERAVKCNKVHTSLRQMAELPYGTICVLFHITHSKMHNWRLLSSDGRRESNKTVTHQFRSLLFYNCYICFYGGTITSQYSSSSPSIEEYFHPVLSYYLLHYILRIILYIMFRKTSTPTKTAVTGTSFGMFTHQTLTPHLLRRAEKKQVHANMALVEAEDSMIRG